MASAESTYADKLRAALDRDGWSQVRLVKELAARTGNAPESERSAVRGYLRGSIPRPERAQLIAEVTGIPELGEVEHPRLSGSSRIERRLEALAVADAQILAGQEKALLVQQRILHELQELRAVFATLSTGQTTAPTQKAR